MNKREISEVRKQLTIKNCSITRLCGCYVDAEKNIRSQWGHLFLSLPEDEIIKYLDILRKMLSGGLGKDMVNLGIQETEESGAGILRDMRATQTEEVAVMDAFYEYIIGNLDYLGPFVVLTAYGIYDIPGKTKDGQELADASEEVYEFVLSCICPASLQKPGLVYDPDKGSFTPLDTARMLSAPIAGILYPAFNGRSQDTAEALCYVHNMREAERKLLERVTGSRILLSATEERAAYMGILERVLGKYVTLKEVRAVEESLQELKGSHSGDEEPYSVGVGDMAMLLRGSGIDEARIGRLAAAFAAEAGPDAKLTLDNLGHLRAFTVEMEEGKLVMDPAHAYKLQVRELEGERVLVMPLKGNVEVNGIRIDIGERREEK